MAGAKMTVPRVAAMKGHDPIVMITAYDAPSAELVDRAGVDVILVGDSVAMVVLGQDDTLGVTMDEMVNHTRAVAAAKPNALVVGDMPWLSYHVDDRETIENAARFIRAGAQAVKLEGGAKRVKAIEAILQAEIPVMGHLGLTPQSVHTLGGYKKQGKSVQASEILMTDALALQEAGVFAIVLECIPAALAQRVTAELSIPTIGIGSGPHTDGQVLVLHDLLGMAPGKPPSFVTQYAQMFDEGVDAVSSWVVDVRKRNFPAL